MNDPRAVTDSGTIVSVDPYRCYGVGLPDGWAWLDDIGPDELKQRLPAIVRHFDRRLTALENRAETT